MAEATVTKKQVHDHVPKRIKGLQFGILSSQDIVNQAVVELTHRFLYENGPGHKVQRNGPLDRRMGVSSPQNRSKCETCGCYLKDCNGHFGYMKLALPAFHIGYLKKIIEILQCICKDCSHLLLDEKSRRSFLKNLQRPGLDNTQRDQIYRKILVECKKISICNQCHASNGAVKKVNGHALKLIHDKYSTYNRSQAKMKREPASRKEFFNSFEEAKRANPDLEKHLKKAVDDLNPLRVLNLFRAVSTSDCELLGMRSKDARPEMLIWQYIPTPPVSIRPSILQESSSNEDDITVKLADIIKANTIVQDTIKTGAPVSTIMERWEFLQIQVGVYINSEVPNLQQPGFGRTIRAFCQRLKGKQGRFRGNLSGKRVDFSGRTVISPDPNLGIDEVAVPEKVATNLTYPERVTRYNIDRLRVCVRRGTKYPGANYITKGGPGGRKIVLEVFTRGGTDRLKSTAEQLQIGDVVERHLMDGDIVLFNRQPSLHKLSVMCHRVKVREWRTFRLNECVCTPYNADFDGDEMNLHVPQTEEARTEALELMGVKHNLATPKDGTPIIAATQDFITAAYLLSNKDRFFDRKDFAQICSYMFDGEGVKEPTQDSGDASLDDKQGYLDIDLPEAAIIKPEQLWTGKQIFNVLMRPSRRSKVLVNFDAPCNQFKPVPNLPADMSEEDAWLCIRNSEIMCGALDKAVLGSGKKDSIFYVIMRDYGPDCAVRAMNRISKLAARWLSNEGFSVGVNDVYPGSRLALQKRELVEKAYAQCDIHIKDLKDGKIERDAGCTAEETLENRVTQVLNRVRQGVGELCFEQLSRFNAPITMAKCGSKGSPLNVAQMVGTVGQQIIGGSRVADGFHDRTLPHFSKHARTPPSKGFVSSSFFSGLNPLEFTFHAMSGREGLVDTAVKTAETGYMSRRLMKSLEDLSVRYDDTVRNSASIVVQFQFGDDKLDPVDMEGKAKPVNFERSFTHAKASEWTNQDTSLTPEQIKDTTQRILDAQKKALMRTTLRGGELPYDDDNLASTDQYESNRDFLRTIEEFLKVKAEEVSRARQSAESLEPKKKAPRKKGKQKEGVSASLLADRVAKVSEPTLREFLKLCLEKYDKSKVQPGHAVGAVGAQSIGEPGTQMTLKTFHFAGVAGMSITQGVPRIKEIINASKIISTPVITCELSDSQSEIQARRAKSRIEKTYLRDIISHMSECWTFDTAYIEVKVEPGIIHELQLDVSMRDIVKAITDTKGLGITEECVEQHKYYIRVYLEAPNRDALGKPSRSKAVSKTQPKELYLRMQNLKRIVANIAIRGFPDTSRAVITKQKNKDTGKEETKLLVEGYGLKSCMTCPGVDGTRTRTNSVMEMLPVLGIEAARSTIISELAAVMGNQMDIDPRHMQLLADVMTYRGDVLGITRFGLAKMRDSVLQLASFEKTPDHLFDAAVKGKIDKIEGVSECIIMGQNISLGTGAMSVVRNMSLTSGDFGGKKPAFESCFDEMR